MGTRAGSALMVVVSVLAVAAVGSSAIALMQSAKVSDLRRDLIATDARLDEEVRRIRDELGEVDEVVSQLASADEASDDVQGQLDQLQSRIEELQSEVDFRLATDSDLDELTFCVNAAINEYIDSQNQGRGGNYFLC